MNFSLLFKKRTFNRLVCLLISIITYCCIDPLEPIFDFQSDIVIINGLASTTPGSTSVKVEKTKIEFGDYVSEFISGCRVRLINSLTKEEVNFLEEDQLYRVSNVFKINPGSKWELEVILPNGNLYRSTTEVTPFEVPILGINEKFNLEMKYDEAIGGYLPGNEIFIDFNDPPEDENFFLYQYKAYEKETYCKVCEYGVLRNGECLSQFDNPRLTKDYYTYTCDSRCWKISYNDEIIVYSDKFTNGKKISNLIVGKIPYTSKQNILVEIQKLNISEDSYKYYKTIKDLVDNNGSLNSPLPTALIGNFTNISNPDETVLGRFTAASAVTKSIFIKRDNRTERVYGNFLELQPEVLGDPIPNPLTYEYSCEESLFRTKNLDLKFLDYFEISSLANDDIDGDEIENNSDNCISTSNSDQSDLDFDGIGDACDNDADGDGYILYYENFCGTSDFDPQSVPDDNDIDSVPDCIDEDDDNDGYIDEYEIFSDSDPFDQNSLPLDSDNDYLPDIVEREITRTNPNNPDTDGDGYIDGRECCPLNPSRN